MHSERKVAWKRLDRAVTRSMLFDNLLEIAGPELSEEALQEALIWQRELEYSIAFAHDTLEEKMGMLYCAWTGWSLEDAKYKYRFSYTTDRDGDGWFWCRLSKSQKHGAIRGIPVSMEVKREERKFRKRKLAKEWALNEYEKQRAKIK